MDTGAPVMDGVIFDADGVLFDTEQYSYYAYEQALQKRHMLDTLHAIETEKGIVFQNLMAGQAVYQNIALLEHYGFVIDTLFTTDVIQYYTQSIQQIKPLEGVLDTLHILHNAQIPYYIGSNGEQNSLQNKLKVSGLDAYITREKCYTADMFNAYKPSPELYQIIMKKHNCAREKTVIIEDSYPGLLAATESGAYVIALLQCYHTSTMRATIEKKIAHLSTPVYAVCNHHSDIHTILTQLCA